MSDKIEKTITINAPLNRVWRAIADYKEYGKWFQCEIDRTFPMKIVAMEENKLFSCYWPAYVEKTDLDLLEEPWLLMEYHLKETAQGTELTIIESGFDKLNAAIRDEARRGNEGGWDFQLNNIRNYLHGEK